MADQSKIQWTEATWNPWHGCHKVSAGCKYCYMFREKKHYGQDPNVVKKSKTKFNDPLKWSEPQLIFTCSWSDWFIEEADAWRNEAWAIIKATPQHTYQILTKRPERIKDHLPADWGEGYANVWLGVSVENQEAAENRIPHLLHTPAAVRFISCEPMLDSVGLVAISQPLSFLNSLNGTITYTYGYDGPKSTAKIDWIIVGGESGNDTGDWLHRPMQLEWLHSIITQAYRFGTPLFVKQMGNDLARELKLKDRFGGNFEEFPSQYKIRQFPHGYTKS